MEINNILEVLQNIDFKIMEPFIGNVNMEEHKYTAMQGIIHLIGWSIFILILVGVFMYMKKHTQQDERMKKYYGNKEEETENKSN
ncbi:hypothetical protein [Hydrogenothermus marinus]|uniref:Uncharacterized protein n=1 Tax=Hydrogenothermus marinus TaxID=133270 RepID=A0A3M0BSM4_9AQUI|nr:hypothetical protein [Hydrogenothermus marinus]RMA97515.1 hypothetical protein CLV39_0128 [Hydrogenothermus marinus]